MHVAFYGAGSIAERHVDAIRRTGVLDISWVVSRAPEHARAFAEKKGIPRWTADEAGPLADPEVGAVVVAYPTFRHAEVALAAFATAKHVVCEKPLSDSVASAEQMVAAARAANRLLLVGQLRRFWPVFAGMHELVASGRAGSLVRSTVDFQAEWDWSNRGWRVERPGGYLLDMHVHELDLLLWFANQEPRRVWATGENRAEREGTVVLEFPSSFARLDYCGRVSGRVYPAGSRTRYQLAFSNGRLEAEIADSVTSETYIGGTKVAESRAAIGQETRAGWDGMWAAFAAALTGSAPSPIAPEEALGNVRTALAAANAMQTRAAQEL